MKKSSNKQPSAVGQEVRLLKQTAIGVVKAVVEATESHPVMVRVLWPSLVPGELHLGGFLAWERAAELDVA